MLSGVTSRRWQAANGQRAAEEHSPADHARGLQAAQQDQRHEGHGGVGAASERVEIQDALAARLDGQELFGPIVFAFGQIADQGDFQGSLALNLGVLSHW